MAGDENRTSEGPSPERSVPVISDELEYRGFLQSVLAEASDRALGNLHRVIDRLPRKATKLVVAIHIGQENEGDFEIRVHAEGSDIRVLNKAIHDFAVLFEGRVRGFNTKRANVPRFDVIDAPFDVAEIIASESIDWLKSVWSRSSFPGFDLPVAIIAEDGCGPLVRPVELQPCGSL